MPGRDLCLLSLDGGGIRGLSSLMILRHVMEGIDPDAEEPCKPCDYFDMIGGTSTGGLIAIMLGRLRMSVDECITAYIDLSDYVFQRLHYLPVTVLGKVQNQFDAGRLKSKIREIVTRHDPSGSEDALLSDPSPGRCNVFVCATSEQVNTDTIKLSSYRNRRHLSDFSKIVKIWEACRATSAAPTFFEPILIGPSGESFVDGATGANNPVREVWTEAADVWKSNGRLQDNLKCLVSIGTGVPDVQAFGRDLIEVGKTLRSISTETERTAEKFAAEHSDLIKEGRYFRFNVLHGLGKIGLENASKRAEISAATRTYISSQSVLDQVDRCCETLRDREWSQHLMQLSERFAVHAEKQLHSIDVVNRKKADTLMWFTNTVLYQAWLSLARGEVVCSRFIWYPVRKRDDFGAVYAAHRRKERVDVLYVDCADEILESIAATASSTINGEIMANKAILILWSLISQAVYSRSSSRAQAAAYLSSAIDADLGRPAASDSITKRIFPALEELLRSALDLECRREVVMVLACVHKLEGRELIPLRTVLQDVIDSQRSDSVAQARVLITGEESADAQVAFKGTATIDEDTEYYECLQSLRFKNIELRRNRIAVNEVGTNHWIWSHPVFLQWRARPSGILWIEGKPGSGKSVLGKSIQNRMFAEALQDMTKTRNTEGSHLICGWFYSIRDGLQAHLLMLRSLLHQLLQQDPRLFVHVESAYRSREQTTSLEGNHWTVQTLQTILLDICKSVDGARPFWCIIDGFDESEHDTKASTTSRKDTLSFLQALVDSARDVRIIILSRPTADIDRSLRRQTRIILQYANASDVRKVTEAGLKRLRQVIEEDDSSDEDEPEQMFLRTSQELDHELQFIQVYIEAHASGVILWVTTIFKALELRAARVMFKLDTLKEELFKLPVDLGELYRDVAADLHRAHSNDSETLSLARRALIWVTVVSAKQPLQLQELLEALTPGTEIGQLNVRSWTSFVRKLQKLCGPFIEVLRPAHRTASGASDWLKVQPDDEVQLLHQSVKDFLEDRDAAGPLYVPTDEALQVVEGESRQYARLMVPDPSKGGSYYLVPSGGSWTQHVDATLSYLESKTLLPLIFKIFPQYKQVVPSQLRSVFSNTLSAITAAERDHFENRKNKYISQYTSKAENAVIEHYFWKGCSNGQVIALENVLNLAGLALEEKWLWYHHEPAVLYGTMLAAIQHQLIPQIKKLAWYIAERGLDLLDRPRVDAKTSTSTPLSAANKLMKEALLTCNEEVCFIVAGYYDAQEMATINQLIKSDPHWDVRPSPSRQQPAHLNRIQDAIELVLHFWGTPPKTDEYQSHVGTQDPNAFNAGEMDGNVYGSNVYGANVYGANVYGANVYGATELVADYRTDRESHRGLLAEMEKLRDSRPKTSRAPAVDSDYQSMTRYVYLSAQQEMFHAEMRAQSKVKMQTTEEEFAQKMNAAVWKTSISYGIDKIE